MQIAPFRPLRYNPERISFISRVLAPPYDVINEQQAETLRQLDPHNVIRLILGKGAESARGESEYAQAAEALRTWRRDGVLLQEQMPALYVCEQTFRVYGQERVRTGLLCAALLDESASGGLLPHEQTREGPRRDRLRLMSACRASLSPVFGVFQDEEGTADELLTGSGTGWPLYEFRAGDIAYRVWRVTDSGRIRRIAQALVNEELLIADGHHRYETALAYREANRDWRLPLGRAPEDYLLLYCVSARNPGLSILPTHRLVKAPEGFDQERLLSALAALFEVEPVSVSRPEALRAFVARLAPNSFGCYAGPGRLFRLTDRGRDPLKAAMPDRSPHWRRLAVTLLHYAVLEPLLGIPAETARVSERLSFTPNSEQVFWSVEGGRFDLAFLMPRVPMSTVTAIARAGEKMPPKSTYFYPKIASGLVISPLDGPASVPVPPLL